MPLLTRYPRWRIVENVVAALQQVIGHDAQWTVIQNAAVPQGGSKRRRQVDVYLQCPSGPDTFRVAIDVKSGRRPLDVEDIEQLCAKGRKLQIDRYVIVSLSGFTSAAEEELRAQGITGMTLDTLDPAAVLSVPPVLSIFALIRGVILVYGSKRQIRDLLKLGTVVSEPGLVGVSIDILNRDVVMISPDGTRQNLFDAAQRHVHAEMQAILLGPPREPGLVVNLIGPGDEAIFDHPMFSEEGSAFYFGTESFGWSSLEVEGQVFPAPVAIGGFFGVEIDDQAPTHHFRTAEGTEIVSYVAECRDGTERQFAVMHLPQPDGGSRLAFTAVDARPRRQDV